MSSHLCITVRFLQPFSHGRGDGGEPEWPPSPLRLFQALVAASAARWNERIRLEYAAPALRWLEQQSEPTIVASVGIVSDVKYRLYVPDNVGDKVAKSWSAGREGTIADYRTEKDVRPTHLKGEEVHYLYPLADEKSPFQDVLTTAARSITHLGWGVDMVASNASVLNEEDVSKLPGERWKPTSDLGGTQLRVPVVGTLDALGEKHEAFLNRLGPDGFTPVPPLSAFRVVGYRRATDIVARSFASFELLRPLDEIAEQSASNSKWRSFDTVRHSGTVAGMVRHAAAESARQFGWDDDRVTSFILGHVPTLEGQAPQATSDDRLMFLPLPSITSYKVDDVTRVKVESIRRVLVVMPTGDEHALRWVRQALSGRELIE